MNIVKKSLAIMMAMVLTTVMSISIPATSITTEAAGIKLSSNKLTMTIGKTQQLKLSSTSSKITWSSSNKKVATVSNNGKVKAISDGTTVVTAQVKKAKYKCMIFVNKPANPYLEKADFKAKEVHIDNVYFIAPTEWNLQVSTTSEGASLGTLSGSAQLEGISVFVMKSEEDLTNSDDVTSLIKEQFTKENLLDLLNASEYGNLITMDSVSYSELVTPNGTALVYEFGLKYKGFTINLTAYGIIVDGYTVVMTNSGLSKKDLGDKIEIAMKSIRIF